MPLLSQRRHHLVGDGVRAFRALWSIRAAGGHSAIVKPSGRRAQSNPRDSTPCRLRVSVHAQSTHGPHHSPFSRKPPPAKSLPQLMQKKWSTCHFLPSADTHRCGGSERPVAMVAARPYVGDWLAAVPARIAEDLEVVGLAVRIALVLKHLCVAKRLAARAAVEMLLMECAAQRLDNLHRRQ